MIVKHTTKITASCATLAYYQETWHRTQFHLGSPLVVCYQWVGRDPLLLLHLLSHRTNLREQSISSMRKSSWKGIPHKGFPWNYHANLRRMEKLNMQPKENSMPSMQLLKKYALRWYVREACDVLEESHAYGTLTPASIAGITNTTCTMYELAFGIGDDSQWKYFHCEFFIQFQSNWELQVVPFSNRNITVLKRHPGSARCKHFCWLFGTCLTVARHNFLVFPIDCH